MKMKSYVTGFILSLMLTLLAYSLVQMHIQSHHQLISSPALTFLIIGLAIAQLFVQMTFFLHLWKEKNPRWNLIFFLSTVSIILIVVGGALWIMDHLNKNMSPGGMSKYIMQDEGIHRTGY